MAESPAHKFGQIIGDVLESAIRPLLQEFAKKHRLYLDQKGPRAARSGNKVKWVDLNGNSHDLDFVVEKGGTHRKIGTPVAFIETAWRRYTKHSRNKAQEIQGALLPLVANHQNSGPFIGAILAGVFTEGALTQLKSLGFTVLYFSYQSVIEAFRHVGIDAGCDEQTPDAEFTRKILEWEALSEVQRDSVPKALIQSNSSEVQQFINTLHNAVKRQVGSVRILPLHGSPLEWKSVEEAVTFIEGYDEKCDRHQPIVRYEILVMYNNGDRIEGQFTDKVSAVNFLRSCEPPPLKPAVSKTKRTSG